jgi:hypothetical protein
LCSLVAVGTGVAGEFLNGNSLFDQCQGEDAAGQRERDYKTGLCTGYVIGVADALHETSFCVPGGPTGVSAAQLRDVVKLYLHDHPERRHYSADSLVTDALKEKFPCH